MKVQYNFSKSGRKVQPWYRIQSAMVEFRSREKSKRWRDGL